MCLFPAICNLTIHDLLAAECYPINESCLRVLKTYKSRQMETKHKPIKIMRRIKEHKNFSALVFSHVGRRYQMKVAAFVLLINNSCICVIFSGESPQHNVFELKRQIHSFSREISLFSTIFRSNIHAAFQRVVQSFAVLTETVERK